MHHNRRVSHIAGGAIDVGDEGARREPKRGIGEIRARQRLCMSIEEDGIGKISVIPRKLTSGAVSEG